ncbi:class I SAM-dependent methyltransferase [Albidovulum sp.]
MASGTLRHPRLALALAEAEARLERARVLVLNAPAGVDLAPLAPARSVLVQGMKPAHDRLARAGWTVVPEAAAAEPPFGAAVIFLPRSRAAGRAAVAEVAARLAAGAPIWIDGQKTDGIESMAREIRARAAIEPPLAKAHGRIFRFDRPADDPFADWQPREMTPAPGFVTLPGLFSADRIDRGSALLAEALPARLGPLVAEFGAGWGWLAAQILRRDGVGSLDLVEADHAALACARRNIRDPRVRFHWADATVWQAPAPLDSVVMNPPFHSGRAAEPALGAAFVAAAARALKPSGQLFMVANRHLPYEGALAADFAEVTELGAEAGFKLIRAARPRPSRPRP